MSEQLKHIFDSSACLSRRQLKDYVIGTMSKEECYALEHHVNTCFFCSEALDGMLEHSGALVTVDELNTGFLKDHFSLTNPQIHLNSLAPAAAAPAMQKRSKSRTKIQPLLLKPSSIAAAVLLGFGALWYVEFGMDVMKPKQIASSIAATSRDKVAEPTHADVAATAPVEEQSASENTSNQQGLLSGENGSNQLNDEPQKVQPLIITDSKGGDEKKSEDVRQKDVSAQPASLAANKMNLTRSDQAAATIALPSPKVEKLPSRSTSDVASLAGGAPVSRKESVLFNESKRKSIKDEADVVDEEKAEKADRGAEDKLAPANTLFESGNYGAAAASYKEQISSTDKSTSQQATLMAARSYLKAGQKEKAKQLLQTLVNEGSGSHRRQAKRLLKDLEE